MVQPKTRLCRSLFQLREYLLVRKRIPNTVGMNARNNKKVNRDEEESESDVDIIMKQQILYLMLLALQRVEVELRIRAYTSSGKRIMMKTHMMISPPVATTTVNRRRHHQASPSSSLPSGPSTTNPTHHRRKLATLPIITTNHQPTWHLLRDLTHGCGRTPWFTSCALRL
ncbi:hypothetical protein Tco_1475253 [Tanacetum coccineum]